MRILLADIQPAMAMAWGAMPLPSGVEVRPGDIFANPVDALVSPANSFGFMDGGIDAVYTRRFGTQLQTRLQHRIAAEFRGELLVGLAVVVETGDRDFPRLISAPTMRVPSRILDPVDVMLATRAAVREALVVGCRSIAMPGMGALTGGVPFDIVAREMAWGIRQALDGYASYESWQEAAIDQHKTGVQL